MSKDIQYKVVYKTAELPIGESVNLLEVFTRKHIINDDVVNEQIIKFVLHDKPRLLPTFIWHKLIKLIVRKEVHFK